jgi:hypothetical protein
MNEDARVLRRLAEWYRGFAETGDSEERDGRLQLATYLDRKAAELEKHGKANLALADFENLLAGFRRRNTRPAPASLRPKRPPTRAALPHF